MSVVSHVTGTAIALHGNDIDTDRIIPARFVKMLTFDALGGHVFEDDRRQLGEAGRRHPFDDPARAEARILVVAKNFGCGSSREHAPQAIRRWGIRAIIGPSFGEIFRGNCATIGLPCVTVDPDDASALRTAVDADPSLPVTLDLTTSTIHAGVRQYAAHLPDSLRQRFVTGKWDTLTELLSVPELVRATVAKLPPAECFPR